MDKRSLSKTEVSYAAMLSEQWGSLLSSSNNMMYVVNITNGNYMENTIRRILIVDDNKDFCFIMAKIITLHGHLAKCATTGTEAIQEAIHLKPHIVLMDYILPDMTGYEVALKIKKHPCLSLVKVVNFTGYSSQCYPKPFFPSVFDYYVEKSSNPGEVLSLIEQYATDF